MDFNEKKEKSVISAIYLESSLLEYLTELLKENVGAKKKDTLNKGFFYYFCRNRYLFGHCLSNAMKKDTFEKASNNKESLIKLIKAWSAKFSRYSKGSVKAIQSIEKNDKHVICYPTLGNQLTLADFTVLTENLSDKELLALIRPPKK